MLLSGQTFCLGAKRLRHHWTNGIFASLFMSYDDFVAYIVLSEYFQIKNLFICIIIAYFAVKLR